MKKTLKFALILAVALPVFAVAQVSTSTEAPSSNNLGQGGSGGPTSEMVTKMQKLEAEQRKLQTPPLAPVTDSNADIAVATSSVEDKVGMLSYAVSLVFIWLIGLTAFILKGAKKQ